MNRCKDGRKRCAAYGPACLHPLLPVHLCRTQLCTPPPPLYSTAWSPCFLPCRQKAIFSTLCQLDEEVAKLVGVPLGRIITVRRHIP